MVQLAASFATALLAAALAVAQTCSGTGTLTYYTTSYSSVIVTGTPSTIIYTKAKSTVTVTVTGTSTVDGPTVTSTVSPPETATIRTRLPAKKTVSVPVTRSCFTAVSCEGQYRHFPTVTSTIKTTVTLTTHRSVTSTTTLGGTYTNYVSAYKGTTTFTYTSFAYSTVYSTSTISSATYTQYAACGKNNLVSKLPDGRNITVVGGGVTTNSVGVDATDAVDCCNKCQAITNTTGCAFSSWSTLPDIVGIKPCELYLLTPPQSNEGAVCKGSVIDGFLGYQEERPGLPSFTVSNGPCGQADPDIN